MDIIWIETGKRIRDWREDILPPVTYPQDQALAGFGPTLVPCCTRSAALCTIV